MSCERMSINGLLVAMTLISSGCASQKALTDVGSEYQKANQAAAATLKDATIQGKATRRLAAAVAYINAATPDAGENLDPKAPIDSFANFVCTGADDFAFSRAGLSYTSTYAGAVAAITNAPDDSISGYWHALSALRETDKPLALREITTHEFQNCREAVRADLPPKGVTAV